MAIPFDCPHCGKGLKARDQVAGQTKHCRYCGKDVVIPVMDANEKGAALLERLVDTADLIYSRLGWTLAWLVLATLLLLAGSLR